MKPLPATLVTVSVCTAASRSRTRSSPPPRRSPPERCSPPQPPRRMYAVFALTTGLTVFLLEPFVAVQGLTTLWQGPDIPILDTQITTEELAYGAAAGCASPPPPWRWAPSCA